jgi:hypothetical protein
MNTTPPTHPSHATRSPLAHVFTIALAVDLSRSERQRYFRCMQAELARAGMLMNYSDGFCVAVKVHDPNWRTDRHLIMNWVIDQPPSREVVMMMPIPLHRMLEGEYTLEADLIRLTLAEEKVSRWLISKVLTGLVTRAIHRLQADGEA